MLLVPVAALLLVTVVFLIARGTGGAPTADPITVDSVSWPIAILVRREGRTIQRLLRKEKIRGLPGELTGRGGSPLAVR